MLYLDSFVGLALMALWIFCVVDVIMTPDGATRNLPKMLWLLLVIFLFEIGAIIWLIAGRPRSGTARDRGAGRGFYAGARAQGFPEYERLGRSTVDDPEADAEFLRQCRERAQAQRARYEQSKKDQSES
ncbi:Phospholipase_D-nuclease N-terminal [Nakamurella panacisegetis]|uniref:Phospholipase_D-nuclease N-terminal n=1 Tax=Nakamurella panacisegetis TaxID=1090615 RepID=A0A1H0PDP9_9ACTN|nr:PLD nuclease N-terminal domain-containing protein [Nakamurella panacisegetis]SDP02880.1 Phospholipase_D-nuclease N-terminal [Nakamurella panacisegetis]